MIGKPDAETGNTVVTQMYRERRSLPGWRPRFHNY